MVRLPAAHPHVLLELNPDFSMSSGHVTLVRAAARNGDYNTFKAALELPQRGCVAKLDWFSGHVKIIKYLLSLPGINAANMSGFTPIGNAAAAGPLVLVQALLEGAQGRIDLNKKSNDEDTPLLIAAANNNYEALENCSPFQTGSNEPGRGRQHAAHMHSPQWVQEGPRANAGTPSLA
ncbi:hypothetical protein BDZ91DRAFT_795239 [Kalaharituber pfeilii]|nr:hypothetical protein BDZ91DRAFT_795239 [Kalaharituber pfeilii]